MALHELRIGPLPTWLDHGRLLGPTDPSGDPSPWRLEPSPGRPEAWVAHGSLESAQAADLAARLRGLGFDGQALVCEVEPPLRRPLVRRARTEDARRRRASTPGFVRPGARLDEVGRMSLTPEVLGARVAAWARERFDVVVDAGCGVGGNAIAFARAGLEVEALELDPERLELARHNARVYEVADKIEFVLADARDWVRAHARPGALLFVDPPWGADWDRRGCGLADLPLLAALAPLAAARGYAGLWAKVPPSFRSAELLGDHPGRADALFGEAEGDRRRVKFVLVRR